MAWQGNRGSRQERGYGAAWDKLRKIALQRDGLLCQPCLMLGRPTTATEVDHVIPKHQGGEDDLDNLQSICRDCHTTKTQLEAAEAQGRVYSPKVTTGPDGWPVE